MLAGHQLKGALDQIQGKYHEENKRALEISKVISLKQMDPLALYHLQEKGECIFSFSEKLFDLDFPGHYNRRIKNIRITLPVIVGPYEGVHATLVQSHHRILTEADINDVKSLLESSEGLKVNTKIKNFSSNEQVVLSRGQQDGGLFVLNFNDERYLPFEGTGALSSWILRMPKKNQDFNLTGLSDVVIHLDYTADDAGETFRDEVEKIDLLRIYEGILALNLKRAFPAEWETFKKSPEAGFGFTPNKELFADELQEVKLDAGKKIYYFLSGKLGDRTEITLFNQQKVNALEGSVVIESKYFELNKSWKIYFSGDKRIFSSVAF